VIKNFELSEDIYQFLDNISFEKDNVKELIEYVHYKALFTSLTYIIENSKDSNLDFLLTDYVEVLNKIEIILNNIKQKYNDKR
jgi:hypothetical protein